MNTIHFSIQERFGILIARTHCFLTAFDGIPPGEYTGEPWIISKLGLDPSKLNDEDLINLMLKELRLIRRPVVRINKEVHFGVDVKVLQRLLQ